MCGIVGVFGHAPDGPRAVTAMSATLVHRGPDAGGAWYDLEAGIALGHRRLSILDLSEAGNQPMVSACGRYVIVLNGEIYNHVELRAELDDWGAGEWKGHSDTETLLAYISSRGIVRTLQRVVGMFAIALWDRVERTLTLARDRMGEKPLYYGWAAGRFAFASELKAITSLQRFDNPISDDALDALLRRGFVPSPLSIYQNLYKLVPGSQLTIRLGETRSPPPTFSGHAGNDTNPTIEAFWDLVAIAREGTASPIKDPNDAIAGLEHHLVESINLQSQADVPLGTFLSGGIDSSTIAALQQRFCSSRTCTFTVGFEEAAFNESAYARAVSEHLGTEHHEMFVTFRDALDVIPQLPQIYDEPFADSSQIPTYLLSKMAKGHVTVALSGDGADELFGGYSRYFDFPKLDDQFNRIPKPVWRPLGGLLNLANEHTIERAARNLPVLRSVPFLSSKIRKASDHLRKGRTFSDLYSMLLAQWPSSTRPIRGTGEQVCFQHYPSVRDLDRAQHMMLWDALCYLPDDILCKVDRASMAVSLETRAPFLDHRVVEFAARIPRSMKLASDGGKWLLRQLLYRHVPRELVDRPKSGFSVPMAEWLRGPLRDWAEALLSPEMLSRGGYFDVALVRSRWDNHLRGSYDYSAALWPVLMFQAWSEASNNQPLSGDLYSGRSELEISATGEIRGG